MTRLDAPLRLTLLLLWAGALAYLSLAGEVAAPGGIRVWDKFSHFAAYAVLAILLIRMIDIRTPITRGSLVLAWLGCCAYGLLLEGLQWAMALGRQFEASDLLANSLGAMAGCVLFCRKTRR